MILASMRCMQGADVYCYFSSAWYLDWMLFPLYVPPFNLYLRLKTWHWQWRSFSHPSPATSVDSTVHLLQRPTLGCPNNHYNAGLKFHKGLQCIWSSYLLKQKDFWHDSIHVALAEEWSAYLVFDVIIFLLTIVQTLRLRRELENIRSIADIFLRDGMCIFPFETFHSQPIRISVFCVCNYLPSRKQGYWWNSRVVCMVNVANVIMLLVSFLCHNIPITYFGTQSIWYRWYQWAMRSLRVPWNVVHVTPFLLECKQSSPCWLY